MDNKKPRLNKSELTLSNINIIFDERESIFEYYSLKDFDKELIENDLFLYRYFLYTKAEEEDFKYLSKSLLSNQIFIKECLTINPDIFFLLEDKFKTEDNLNLIKRYHQSNFLKYDTEENKKDYHYCLNSIKKNISNFQYCDETLRTNINFVIDSLNSTEHYKTNLNAVRTVIKNIPSYALKNEDFVNKIIDNTILSYPYLPLKFRSDFKTATKAVLSKFSFFNNVPEELLNNIDFINQFINLDSSNTFRDDFSNIFLNIPEQHFNEDFCKNKNIEKYIYSHFKKLPNVHRKNLNIIKTVYSNTNNHNGSDVFSRTFLNTISNKEVREGLFSIKHDGKDIVNLSKQFVDSYILSKLLNSSIDKNNTPSKKIKI